VVAGRSPENAVSIPDNSVSRKHLLLRHTAEGWMASDMGSGNGTLINGMPLKEETLLENGDCLSLGETELQFVSKGKPEERRLAKTGGAASDARRPARKPASRGEPGERRLAKTGGDAALEPRRPQRTSLRARRGEEVKKKRRGLLLVVLMAMLSLAGVAVYLKMEEEKTKTKIDKTGEIEREKIATLDARFQEGKNLVRIGNWVEAQHVFQELKEQAPDYRPSEIEEYLKEAELEVPNQAAMNAAQDALSLLELKEAHMRLGQVTNTRHQYERLGKLKQEFQKALQKKVAMSKELVPQNTNRESMVKLKTMTDDILAAVPKHREAEEMQRIAKEAIHRIDNPYRAPPPPETPWVAVGEKYKAGEVEEATQLATACADRQERCKKMLAQLESFSSKNRRIEGLSAQEFFDMYELDRQLSGGAGSPNTQRILMFAIPSIEKRARDARLNGRLGEASGLSSGLLKIDAKNATAQSILDEVRAQAKETYLRAYTLRSTQPDQAEKLFKEVVQLLPKGEDYVKRAQEQLRVLKGKHLEAE